SSINALLGLTMSAQAAALTPSKWHGMRACSCRERCVSSPAVRYLFIGLPADAARAPHEILEICAIRRPVIKQTRNEHPADNQPANRHLDRRARQGRERA